MNAAMSLWRSLGRLASAWRIRVSSAGSTLPSTSSDGDFGSSSRWPASDVYGVGILLYELVTGQVPWDGAVQKILAGHLEELPKSPSLLVEGGVDPALETLILHALAKRPSERHKDMAAFIY